MLTQEYLKSILDYNPDTGVFRWIKPRPKIRVGDVAGCINNSHGNIQIIINKKLYQAHRLAWMYMYGEFPNKHINHINHIKTDNRINNLRVGSGITGVHWHKITKKWRAMIMIDNKTIYLGIFTNLEEAAEARKQAEVNYGFHANHGVAA